jgi:hypothetical protein
MVGGVPSSYLDLNDPGFLAFEYMQQMAAVVDAVTHGPLKILHLGAAGCALARYWDAERPGSRQLAVDIDARLNERVRAWFDLPRAPRLRLRAADAAEVLRTTRANTYDVIVRDVFSGAVTPEHLIGLDVAEAARAALAPGGVYLVNCGDRPPLTLARRELATITRAFTTHAPSGHTLPAHAALIAEPGILKGRRYGNLVIAAVKPPVIPDDEPSSSGSTPSSNPLAMSTSATAPGPAPSSSTPTQLTLAESPLTSPALARALRALPVPAHILTGTELTRFAGTAAPLIPPHNR